MIRKRVVFGSCTFGKKSTGLTSSGMGVSCGPAWTGYASGTDQALDDAQVFRAQFGPTEYPIFLAHWNGAKRPFQVVGVWLHFRVLQGHGQAGFPT